tara:strand:+ start:7481 stop:8752 length:1272 start_codon:yes stop_codon:yes gene_type:complete
MASLTKETQQSGNITYAVDVVVPDIGRKRIRLGSIKNRAATRFLMRIQSIEDVIRLGSPVYREDEEWLRNLPSDQFDRIHRSGLLDRTSIPSRLLSFGDWILIYLESTAVRCSERTVELYKDSVDRFCEFIGVDTSLAMITRDHTESWNDSLIQSGIATASVRRHIRHLKTCINAAIKRDLLIRNPFDRIDSASVAAERGRILPDEESERVLTELPSLDYKILFALARFGGLRSPSETTILTWDHIDLENNRMEVYAPKTGQTRTVPILPQLREVLEEQASKFDGKPTGLVLSVSKSNHGRTIKNAAMRAGVELWKNTFQTLRQSFETILCEQFPEHVVAAWTGHSLEVSRNHYQTMRDEYLDDAARRSTWRSTDGRNEGEFDETERNGAGSVAECKTQQHNMLSNSPARIRTGDRAIMSREL